MTDTIIMDRREPDRRAATLEASNFEVIIPDDQLESGDLILQPPHLKGKQVGIETKTTMELLSLVPSGLSNLQQFQRMLSFDHRVLLLVGYYGTWGAGLLRVDGYDKRNMAFASVWGALFNLQAHLGFLIRFAYHETEYGRAVRNIWDFFNQDHLLLSKPRPLTLSAPNAEALALLMSVPGVGQVQAQRLLTRYGSLRAAMSYIEDWDTDVDGIGPVTRKKAQEFFNRVW